MSISEAPMTANDRRWREESDARTLAEAKVISNDVERMEGAKNAATRMAEDLSKDAKAMRGVSNRGKKNTDSEDITVPKKKSIFKQPIKKGGYNVFRKIG